MDTPTAVAVKSARGRSSSSVAQRVAQLRQYHQGHRGPRRSPCGRSQPRAPSPRREDRSRVRGGRFQARRRVVVIVIVAGAVDGYADGSCGQEYHQGHRGPRRSPCGRSQPRAPSPRREDRSRRPLRVADVERVAVRVRGGRFQARRRVVVIVIVAGAVDGRDSLYIRQLERHIIIGLNPAERLDEQKVLVDLEFRVRWMDTPTAVAVKSARGRSSSSVTLGAWHSKRTTRSTSANSRGTSSSA
jgi:hypothetical protein